MSHKRKAMTTEESIIRLKAKDPTAQGYIYRHYKNTMLSTIYKLTKNKELAEEILNDAFLRAFNKIHMFDSKGSFEGWLRRIVRRTALGTVKQECKRPVVVPIGEERPTRETVTGIIHCQYLRELILELPPKTAKAMNMFIEGYTHKEIGFKLDITEGTSKWHVSSGKALLKQMIEQ